jgi:hypothetical protein
MARDKSVKEKAGKKKGSTEYHIHIPGETKKRKKI